MATENHSHDAAARNHGYEKSSLIAFFHYHYPTGFLRKVVAEVISTFLLVFATCGAAVVSASDERRIPKLGASLVGGLIVTVMIYAVGHVSGAHMNPAVTTAFAAGNHFPWKQVPPYAVAQFTGSIIASFTLKRVFHPVKLIGVTSPAGSSLQALVVEIIVTFTMMFVTMAVATDGKAVGELAGVAVGASVTITSIFAGAVSGGSMNPARTLGPALASSYYKSLWVYFIGPPTGTLLAVFAYKFVHAIDKPLALTQREKSNHGAV